MQPIYRESIIPSLMAYRQSDGVVTAPYTSSQGMSTENLVINAAGVTNGDFRSPNRYAYEKTTGNGLRGRCYRFDKRNPDKVDPTYVGAIERTGGFNSPLSQPARIGRSVLQYDRAFSNALSKLNENVRGNLDLSIDFFQGRQMIKSAERVYHFTKTFRDSVASAKRRGAIKEVASLYLEWTYGIKPSLDDLLQFYHQIFRKASSDQGLFHFRGRGGYSDRAEFSQMLNVFQPDDNILATYTSDISVRCQLDIYLSPAKSRLQTLSEYTSLNPIGWLYELTPYSFVLDWFIDLGGYMRNMETALINASRFVSGCCTYSYLERTSLLSNVLTWGDFRFTDATGDHQYRLYSRKALDSYPYVQSPVFNPRIGSKRILNAAALLSQIIPDLPKKGRTRFRPAHLGRVPSSSF